MRILLFAVAIIALAVPALANDGGVWGIGGSAELISPKHSSIRMVSEKVEATLGSNRLPKVRCTFVFKNEGEATTVKMGFPETAVAAAERIRDFRSWVDGKPVQTRLMPDKNASDMRYDAWYVKDVPFAAGQTRTVVNTYTGGMGYYTDGKTTFRYVLRTGASWKDRIGEAVVIVDTSAVPDKYRLDSISPQGYTSEGSIIKWVLRDFEPSEDVLITFVPNPDIIIRHNGNDVRPIPYILDGRKDGTAMVSARGLQYEGILGIGLTWRKGNCEMQRRGQTLSLRPGSKTAVLNETQVIDLPQAPYIRDGRIIVPAAAVIKALGGAAQLVKENGAEKLILAM